VVAREKYCHKQILFIIIIIIVPLSDYNCPVIFNWHFTIGIQA